LFSLNLFSLLIVGPTNDHGNTAKRFSFLFKDLSPPISGPFQGRIDLVRSAPKPTPTPLFGPDRIAWVALATKQSAGFCYRTRHCNKE
jgi:hypothetical protein